MKKPRFTDSNKWPHAYRRSENTDITVTWDRARKQIEKDKAERAVKVRELKHLGAKK